jgi:hypothetical protein
MTYSPQQQPDIAFTTTDVLANAAVYSSGVLSLEGRTQVQTEVLASHDGSMEFIFYSDAGGTDIVRSLTVPYVAADGFQLFGATTFGHYVQYKFTNNSGSLQTDFYFSTKRSLTAQSGQTLATDGFIATAMIAPLNRSILTGQKVGGTFGNVSVTETTNDAGSYNNLNVVSGARPSQLDGRTKVSEVVDTTASVLQRTVTTDKDFYVTDITLTVDNTDTANTGRVNLRDGTTVAGAIVLPILIAESPNNESVVTVFQHTFAEPLLFGTGVYIEEAAGTLTIAGVLIGYEE